MITIWIGAIASGVSAYIASLYGVPLLGTLAIGLVVLWACMWWEGEA